MKQSSPPPLPKAARRAAWTVLPRRFGGLPTRWTAMNVSPGKAAQAVVYTTRLWPGGKAAVVKAFAREEVARSTFDRQMDAARRYSNTLRNIHYSSGGRAIFMQRAPGKPGLAALGQFGIDRVFEGPVRWIRHLHDEPVGSPKTIAARTWYEYRFLRDVVADFPFAAVPHRHWHRVATEQVARSASTLHGDFQPGNIISTGDDFTIIDFDRPETGSAVLELAQLFVRLQLHGVGIGQTEAEWCDWRDRLLRWYGRPDLVQDAVFACAIQYWRLGSLRGAAAHKNPKIGRARLDHLRERLSRQRSDLAAISG